MHWPLGGRSKELRLIESALLEGDSSGVVVRGAVGVGKSRLAREALSRVSAHGWQHRWLVGTTSAQAIPFGALSDWVTGGDIGLDTVRTVIDNLTKTDAGKPAVICVDDVTLLDDLTTFVVHQIARRGAAKLILTVRDGEPVGEAVREIWSCGQFQQVVLQPLSRDEVRILLCEVLGGAVDSESGARLWRMTRGNPLYLRNIVEREMADGRLAQQGGVWIWTGRPVMPPGLVELIERRMSGLPAEVADVIDILAVAEPLGIDQLSSITVPDALEQAEIRGLIYLENTDGAVNVRLAHPLYGEVRRERAAQTRLRRLRGLIATQLTPPHGIEDTHSVVRRAALRLDSDLAPDPDLFAAAAQGAVALADMPLADRLADAAIRAGAGAQACFTRAWALAWLKPCEADALLAGIPPHTLTEEDRVLRAGYRFACRLWGLADPDGAKEILDDVARDAPERIRDWVDAQYVMYWGAMAKPDKAIAAAAAVDLADLPGLMGAATSWALGVAFGHSGRTARALTTFHCGYEIVAQTGQGAHLRYLIGDRHLGVLLKSGLIHDAEVLSDQLRQQAMDLPGVAQLLSTAIAGRVALGAGRPAQAHALLGPVVEAIFAAGDVNGLGYRYQISDTIALAMSGDIDSANAALTHLEQNRYRSYGFIDYECLLAHAWVAANQGMVAAAIQTCLAAAQLTAANGQLAAEVVCLQTATQFGDRSCGERLQELAAMVEGPRAALAARFANAVRLHAAAELAALSGEYEQMGDFVAAVDTAAHAALAYRQQDRRGSALGCSTRAEALAAAGGITTPALRQAVDRLPLTDREREIVMLLGENLSTPAIADRLTLSRRTVENHIYRAMTKTGVTSRDELAALLSHDVRGCG